MAEPLDVLRAMVAEQRREVDCLAALTRNLVNAHFCLKAKVTDLEQEFHALRSTLHRSGILPFWNISGKPCANALEDLLEEPRVLDILAMGIGVPEICRLCASSQSCRESVIHGAADMGHLDGFTGLEDLHDFFMQAEGSVLEKAPREEAPEQRGRSDSREDEGHERACLELGDRNSSEFDEDEALERACVELDAKISSVFAEEVQEFAPILLTDALSDQEELGAGAKEVACKDFSRAEEAPPRPTSEESLPPLVPATSSGAGSEAEPGGQEEAAPSEAGSEACKDEPLEGESSCDSVEDTGNVEADAAAGNGARALAAVHPERGVEVRARRCRQPRSMRERPEQPLESLGHEAEALPSAHASTVDLNGPEDVDCTEHAGMPVPPGPGEPFRYGQTVMVGGMRRSTELNGAMGRLVSYCAASQRWRVALSCNKHIQARAVNLRYMSFSPGAEESSRSAPSRPARSSSQVSCLRFPWLRETLTEDAMPEEGREQATLRDFASLQPRSLRSQLAEQGGLVVAGSLVARDVARGEGLEGRGVYCLMPSRNDWMRLPDLRRARWHSALAEHGSEVYMIGGRYENEDTSIVERFSSEGSAWEWETMPPMFHPRSAASAAVVDSDIYVAGGCSHHGRCLRLFERFRIPLGTWQRLPPLFHGRLLASASGVAGDVYIYAGFGLDNQCVGSIERFSPSASSPSKPIQVGAWTGICQMPGGTQHFASAVCKSYLYILGGDRGDGQSVSTAHRFNHRHSRMEQLPPMRMPRRGGVAAALPCGDIVVCGGCVGAVDTALSSVEIFRLAMGDWETVQPMLRTRVFPSHAVLGGVLYVMGGIYSEANNKGVNYPSNSVDCFDLLSERWRAGAPVPISVLGGCSVCLMPVQEGS